MPRLTNPRNGVIINVSDETAQTLGTAWVPASDEGAKAEEKPKRRSSASS